MDFKQRLLAIKTLGTLVATLVGPLAHAQIIAVDDYYQVPQGTTVTVDFLENDVGDNLEVVEIAIPYPRSFEWSRQGEGSFTVIPDVDLVGVIKIIYKVRDANLDTDKATVTIEYLAPAEPPVEQPPAVTSLADVLDKVAPIQALAQVSQQAALGHSQVVSQFLRSQNTEAGAGLVYRAVTPLGASAGDSGLPRGGVFVSLDAARLDGKAVDQLAASTSTMQSLTAGVDLNFDQQWVLGAAVGVSSASLNSDKVNLTNVGIDELALVAFTSYQFKQWSAEGQVGYSQSTIKSAGQDAHQRFNTDGGFGFGLLKLEYTFSENAWRLQPGIEVRQQRGDVDGFADEATDTQINYDAQESEHSIAALSLYGSYRFNTSIGVITPQMTLASEYCLDSTTAPLAITVNNERLVMDIAAIDDNQYLVANLGVGVAFKYGVSGFINLHQVLQHRAYGVQALQFGLRKEF